MSEKAQRVVFHLMASLLVFNVAFSALWFVARSSEPVPRLNEGCSKSEPPPPPKRSCRSRTAVAAQPSDVTKFVVVAGGGSDLGAVMGEAGRLSRKTGIDLRQGVQLPARSASSTSGLITVEAVFLPDYLGTSTTYSIVAGVFDTRAEASKRLETVRPHATKAEVVETVVDQVLPATPGR